MRLIVSIKPSHTLLQMFNEISAIPGDWIDEVCGIEVSAVRRAEYNKEDCAWKECIFVPTEQYFVDSVHDHAQLIDRLRSKIGINLTSGRTSHILEHNGVLGICFM